MHEFTLPKTMIRSIIAMTDVVDNTNVYVVFRPEFENILTIFEDPIKSKDHYLNSYITNTHNPAYKEMGYDFPLVESLQFSNIELMVEHTSLISNVENENDTDSEFPYISLKAITNDYPPIVLPSDTPEGIIHTYQDKMFACMTTIHLRTENLELATMIRMAI